MADAAFKDTAAFLTKTDAKGQSLQDHLTNVLLSLGKERLDDALSSFEDLSAQTKSQLVVPLYADLDASTGDEKCKTQLLNAVDEHTKVMSAEKDGEEDDGGGEDGEPGPMPDVLAQARLFEAAGISLGADETYLLFCSMDRLIQTQAANEAPLAECRFFGKVFCLKADYFIIEGKFAEPPEAPDDEGKIEPPGQPGSANEYSYFVTNSLTGEFTQLPHLEPEMVILSRSMRRYFTGDLKAPVRGFPRFPWNEDAYLRAQIARIVAATYVAPAGFYEAEEAEEGQPAPLMKAETFTAPTTAEMTQHENWLHSRGFLFKNGRLVPEEPADDDGGDDDDGPVKKAEPEEIEIPPPQLNPIDLDQSPTGQKIWSLRPCGPTHFPHSVISLHNLAWPGSVSVYCQGEFASIYMGFGHKYIGGPYRPPPPPKMQAEYVATGAEAPMVEQFDPPQTPPVDPNAPQQDPGDGDDDDD